MEVIKGLAAAPDEIDRFFDAYDKFGLDGVVAYLRRKDLDLTHEDAIAIGRSLIAEKDNFVQKTERDREYTAGSEGATIASQEDKDEKWWIDRWLKR